MDVQHIYTESKYLNQLPVVNGQVIALTDRNRMYYDLGDVRHPVESDSAPSSDAVTLTTEQTVTGKKYMHDVHVSKLTQGVGCTASEGSHAEGENSSASVEDSYAHAEGGNTQATGRFSHSQGMETVASGIGSAASGYATLASGDYSSANGVATVASAEGSFTAGLATTAASHYSTAIGVGNNHVPGDLFEIGNGTILDENGDFLPEDAQIKRNAFRVTEGGVAIAQTDVELESGVKLSDRESVANKVTTITEASTDAQYPSARAVMNLINSLPEPMIYKGTLGTSGTITGLPTASAQNTGFTYKVITAGTYAGQAAKVGDCFISRGTVWDLIPSGDEPSGTVTNVAAQGSNGIQVTGGPITTSGTLQISGVNATQSSAGMMSPTDKKKLDGISESADSVSVTQALTSGVEVGSVTVNGQATKLYAPKNTDTHFTTGLKVGASATATANAAATNGNVYLNVLDNTTVRDSHKIVGSGSVSVTSDANGVITIKGTDTNDKYTHPNSGVTAGTYRNVTVNAQGHVTAGNNTTLTVAQGGTGATDAATARTNLGLGSAAIKNSTDTIASGGTALVTSGAVYGALSGKANSSHTHTIANVNGLQDALDDKLDKTVTNLGAMTDKTIIDLQNGLNEWLKTCCNAPNARATFTANNNFISLWNNSDTATKISAGANWTAEIETYYVYHNYVLLKLTTYSSKQVYYVEKSNGTWGKITKVSFDGETATTATALTSKSIGSSKQPVYFDANGKPVAISYTIEKSVPSNAVFTDTNTHYTTGITAGASGTTSNAAASNPYIKIKDDSTHRGQIQLKGAGATTISSDANGVITISSTDTNTDTKVTSVGNHYTPSADSNASLSADASSSTAATWNSTSLVTGVNLQRDAKGHVTGVTVDSIKMPANPNSDTNTAHSHSAGVGLVGSGNAGTSGTYTYKAKLRSETALTVDSAAATTTSGKVYPVAVDKSGYLAVNVPWTDSNTDTKNTAGSTDSSSKLFLIGATSQAANPRTYSHDTAYVGTDGCLYSGGSKVLTSHPTISTGTDTTSTASPSHGGTVTMVDSITRDSNGHVTKVNTKTVTLPSDTNTDTKVTQALKSDNKEYPLLLAPTGQTATATTTACFDSGVTLNPSTNTIAANISGTAADATKLGGKSLLTKNATDTWDAIPYISDTGVVELGKYIDFHVTDGNTSNYDVRVEATTDGLTLGGKTTATLQAPVKVADDRGQIRTVIGLHNAYPADSGVNAEANGSELTVTGGANVFIGGGESPFTLRNNFRAADTTATDALEDVKTYDPLSEQAYVSSDSHLWLYSNANSFEDRKGILFNRDGELLPLHGLTYNIGRGDGTFTWNKVFAREFSSPRVSQTWLKANQGEAIINSTAGAGAFVVLDKLNSTNGYFCDSVYQNNRYLTYTDKATVDAGTNKVTYSVTLLNEKGNSSFPGELYAQKFKGDGVQNLSAKGDLALESFTEDGSLIINKNTLAWWNGAYNSDHKSNLTYCAKGAFGDAAVRGVKTLSSRGPSGIDTNSNYLTDVAFVSRWDGRYDNQTETNSNLMYCNKGKFGDAVTKDILNNTAIGTLGYVVSTAPNLIPTVSTIAYWDGSYKVNASTGVAYSNLAYCARGKFGDAVTKGVDTTATKGSANLITSGAMYTALSNKLGKNDAAASAKTVYSKTATFNGDYYKIPFYSNDVTNGNATIIGDGAFLTRMKTGTASAEGYVCMSLGNSTASGADGNTYGAINIYGKTAYRTQLTAGSPTANRNITLPDAAGTLALTTSNVASATKVNGTLTNPTSATSYSLPFHTGGSNGNKSLLFNDGCVYRCLEGTATANGYGILVLGNKVASGTAGNKYGSILMYGKGANYTQINTNPTANRTVNLPNASGTLALQENTANKKNFGVLQQGDSVSISLDDNEMAIVTALMAGSTYYKVWVVQNNSAYHATCGFEIAKSVGPGNGTDPWILSHSGNTVTIVCNCPNSSISYITTSS